MSNKGKRVLITAGTVYGKLDDNKLVGNRIRGIWATKFAEYLKTHGHVPIVLVPDTFDKNRIDLLRAKKIEVLTHCGYEDYAIQCLEELPKRIDAAVMAAAVVNWIPAGPYPIKGKMSTEGYKENDIIEIPFRLAPRVIDRMKDACSKYVGKDFTLIGCKMTSGSTYEEMHKMAYKTLLNARCNAVIANDLQGLKSKFIVGKDGSSIPYENDFLEFYAELMAIIEDEYFETWGMKYNPTFDIDKDEMQRAKDIFDGIVEKYRDRFVKRVDGEDKVFGSVAVRVRARTPNAVRTGHDGGGGMDRWSEYRNYYLVSPREKGQAFTSEDAVLCCLSEATEFDLQNQVLTLGFEKATLNAPLMIKFADEVQAEAVIHLHEQDPDILTDRYAPPGTVRDTNRKLKFLLDVGIAKYFGFNIEYHGLIHEIDADTYGFMR